MADHDFPACPVCGSGAWTTIHDGLVRDGAYGSTRRSRIGHCGDCGIDRLAESACLVEEAYSGDYRRHVGQDHDLAKHYASHDELARFSLDTLWPQSLRGKVVADVGCGGGSLLDHISGLPSEIAAIDPDRGFAPSLVQRGYRWYESVKDASRDLRGRVQIAFAIQVIEHVTDPRTFLAEIGSLLAPDGILLLSTPNRADILMQFLPDEFPSFFYRTQHRWYFDAASLSRCVKEAGLRMGEVRHVQRYGMSNALLWLRERKPAGRNSLPGIDRAADDLWSAYLNASGRSDNLYAILRAP